MVNDVCVLIPAYNPDKKLFLEFAKKLVVEFSKIIVINDGSKKECDDTFNEIAELDHIKIIKHGVNLGKGRALKTGFNEIINNYPECIGAVCADCDGQHCVEDIINCCNALKEKKDSYILGARNFDQRDVPTKSKYGNKITRNIFKIFIGIKIQDTQTGLRALSIETMKKFMKVFGERYEFETNVLIECKNSCIDIVEVPIKTIYIEKNQTSHFNPVKDSISIYKMFAKYILSAISSFIIDIILFYLSLELLNKWNIICNITIFNKWNVLDNIIVATIIARIISSIYNFKINGKVVFKNINSKSLIRYFVLVIIQMFVSAFCVDMICILNKCPVTLIKIIVDCIIFVVNFVIQREFVFKK